MPSRAQDRDPTTRTSVRVEERIVLIAVVVVAAVLRWHWLGQPVRYDEAVTWLEYASRPLSEALALYDLPNNHLFHTFLAHLSAEALGPGVRSLRMPAFLAGVLTVPATWALGRRLSGAAAGLVAAAAVAVSPVLVLFSTNARGYSLVVLAFLVMAVLAADLRHRSSSLLWAGFAGTAALAGWTMPAALYPAVGVGLWILWPARRGEPARPLADRAGELALASVGAAAATALLYLPVLRRTGWRSVVANRFVAPDPLGDFLSDVPGFLAEVLREWAHGVPEWIVVPVALGAVASALRAAMHAVGDGTGTDDDAAARHAAGGRGGAPRPPAAKVGGAATRPPPLLPAALLGSAVVLLATRRTPFARVWLFLLPAVAVFAAAGLRDLVARVADLAVRAPGTAARRAGQATAGMALLLLIGGGMHIVRADPVASWGLTGSLPAGDRVAALLDRRMAPGDAVRAPLPYDAPLEFYFSLMGRGRDPVNDVPAPGACLWIVENRRHGSGTPGVAPPGDGGRRLVRDFGASAVYVRPPADAPAAEPRPGRPGASRPEARRCGPIGGDTAGSETDSPRRPPAQGDEEPAER